MVRGRQVGEWLTMGSFVFSINIHCRDRSEFRCISSERNRDVMDKEHSCTCGV